MTTDALSSPEPEPAQRQGPEPGSVDRRCRDLPLWHPRRLRGRRMRNCQADAIGEGYLVDRISGFDFAMAALLLVLTLTDGVITVVLLEHGCEEANPLMRLLLERGIAAFLFGKYVLTAMFLPVALVLHRYRMFGTRFRVGQLVPLVAALYLVLILYQVGLWRSAAARGMRLTATRAAVVSGGR